MSANTSRPPTRFEARAGEHGPAGGHLGVGQVEHDGVVVAQRPLGLVESVRASSTRLACTSSDLAADSCASRLSLPATIFGRPASLTLRAAVPERSRGALTGLLHLALLALQQLLGVADVGLGGLLRSADGGPRTR